MGLFTNKEIQLQKDALALKGQGYSPAQVEAYLAAERSRHDRSILKTLGWAGPTMGTTLLTGPLAGALDKSKLKKMMLPPIAVAPVNTEFSFKDKLAYLKNKAELLNDLGEQVAAHKHGLNNQDFYQGISTFIRTPKRYAFSIPTQSQVNTLVSRRQAETRRSL